MVRQDLVEAAFIGANCPLLVEELVGPAGDTCGHFPGEELKNLTFVGGLPGGCFAVESTFGKTSERPEHGSGKRSDDHEKIRTGREVDACPGSHAAVHVTNPTDGVGGEKPRHGGRCGDEIGEWVICAMENGATQARKRAGNHRDVRVGRVAEDLSSSSGENSLARIGETRNIESDQLVHTHVECQR